MFVGHFSLSNISCDSTSQSYDFRQKDRINSCANVTLQNNAGGE